MKTLKKINKGCGVNCGCLGICGKNGLCPTCKALKEQMEWVIWLVNYNYEAHQRYGEMTIESEMRFKDLLKGLKGEKE